MGRPRSMTESGPGLWRVLRHFWPWIRREKALIAGSMLALGSGVLLRLAEPWPLKFVLDRLIPTARPGGLNTPDGLDTLGPGLLLVLCALAVVGISGLRAISDYHQRIGLSRIGIRVLRRIRTDLYNHLQGLSLSFHNRARSGDLIVRVTRDVSLLRDVTSTAVLPLIANSLVIVGMLIVMFTLQWKLALLTLTVVPLFWISTVRLGRGIHVAARKQRAREGDMAATAAESITAIRDVQALSLEESFSENFASRNRLSQKEDLKAARLSARLGRTVDVLQAVAIALVLWFGARQVLSGTMTPGDLVVFLTYIRRLFSPAKDFAKYTGRLAKAAAAGERVVAVLQEVPEVRDLPTAVAASSFRGDIRFQGVDFAYAPGAPILHAVEFHIEPGKLVALTGPSGSGKSTLFSLLLRLYDPVRGRVMIDGKDLREYTLASLRSQISVVLQDAILFAGTVRDNISCSHPDATTEQIEHAARLARADEFIRALPDGYDTAVGERGATLSQGQRQRIAIARAALRNAPILLLDEPTTGLDERNGREIAAVLDRVWKGTTTIVATHDLRLAGIADVVLYIEDGRVLECGSPDELIAAGLGYAELHHLQANGRIG